MPRKNSAAALAKENEKLRAQLAAVQAGGAVEAPAVLDIEKPKLSGSVTVACKIPQGLILQLQHPMKRRIPTGRGSDNDFDIVEVMVYGGKRYHVFGPSLPAQIPSDYIVPQGMEGGYALTHDIPADFWAQWVKQHELADYVVNKMIFAYDPASAKSAAREHGELKSGLEPLAREAGPDGVLKDRRVPKSLNTSVSRIQYDAARDAERGNKAAAV